MSQDNWKNLCPWIEETYSKDKNIDKLLASCIQSGWDISSVEMALKFLEIEIIPPQPVPFPKFGDKINMDLGDRQVHLILSMKNPNLVVVGNMLSDEECGLLIEMSIPRLTPSKLGEPKTGIGIIGDERKSQHTFFQRTENELVSRIESRIARFLDWPIEYGEGLQVLCSKPGQEFKPHHDYIKAKALNQRTATLIIYLNEPEEGGATIFPDINLEILPKKGNAVFFNYDRPYAYTRTLHGGAPVIMGEKWIATKWLHSKAYQSKVLHNTSQTEMNY